MIARRNGPCRATSRTQLPSPQPVSPAKKMLPPAKPDGEGRPERAVAVGASSASPNGGCARSSDLDARGRIAAHSHAAIHTLTVIVSIGPSRVPRTRSRTAQDRVVAEAGDDQRPVALPEPAKGRQVEMVVMIVADEDEVDRRQILEAHAGRAHAIGAERRKGRGDVAPDRVGEDVEALGLNEDGGMADPGDPHLRALDAPGRHGRGHRHVARPGRPFLGTGPATEEIAAGTAAGNRAVRD